MNEPREMSKSHWKRYSGENDWKVPNTPGSGLVHLPCGRSEIKVIGRRVNIWLSHSAGLGPCANEGELKVVGFLQCEKCHKDEKLPDVLTEDDIFVPGG